MYRPRKEEPVSKGPLDRIFVLSLYANSRDVAAIRRQPCSGVYPNFCLPLVLDHNHLGGEVLFRSLAVAILVRFMQDFLGDAGGFTRCR